jgi:ferric enterobactin receptor
MKSISAVIFFILIISYWSAKAQQPINQQGKINGLVLDSLSDKPIEYATIALLQEENKKAVNGTTADARGHFEITNIPEGRYILTIFFMGYKAINKAGIVINKENPLVSINSIKLVPIQINLKEVSITADKNIIENRLDKMVYNVDKDVTSQGGVATDILKKVPQVSVDVDGNVELQGNGNIRFLIDGKPSSIFGNSVADVLQSIPSSQIKSIEIITNPGAKYDAEGTGGIINIILKKNEAQGFNGNISLTTGSRLENGSINLNARKGKLNVNTFLNGNAQLKSAILNSSNRLSKENLSSESTRLIQNGVTDFSRNGYQGGIGFDYALSSRDDINGAISVNHFGNSNSGTTNRQQIHLDANGNPISSISSLVDAENNFHSETFDWNLNYKRTFKKEEQAFDILYSASNANNYGLFQQTQYFTTPSSIFSGSKGNNPGQNLQSNISINYTHPITKSFLIETGAKTVIESIQANSDIYIFNAKTNLYDFSIPQSSINTYKRDIYAYYLSGTFKLSRLDIKAGSRIENTQTNANFSNAGNLIIAPYTVLVPSLVVSFPIDQSQTIKLSYSHRIQRPNYRDLNPFNNASDPKNITTGNPHLTPELADNIELGYNKYFQKETNINVSLFYRGNRDDIQSFTRYFSSYTVGDSTYKNVAITTRENIGLESNIGLNIFASVPISSKIQLRTNTSMYQRYIYNNLEPSNNISGFNYRINFNGTYQITPSVIFEAFLNYNSPRTNVQGTMPSFTTYNLALRKQLFHKKGSIAFTTTNPFTKYVNQVTNLTGQNFTLYNLRELPYQSFGINFTYKFGKMEFKKQKALEDVNLTNPPISN